MSVQFSLVQIRPSVHIYNYVRFIVGMAISNTLHLKIYKFEIVKFLNFDFFKISNFKIQCKFLEIGNVN